MTFKTTAFRALSALVIITGCSSLAVLSASAQTVPGGTQIQDAIQSGGVNNLGSNSQWLGQHGPNYGTQTEILRQIGSGNLGVESQHLQQSGAGNLGNQLQGLGQYGNGNVGVLNQYLQQHGAHNTGAQLQNITQFGQGNLGIQGQDLRQYGIGNGATQQQGLVQGGYDDPTQIQRAIQSGNGNRLGQTQNFLQAQ